MSAEGLGTRAAAGAEVCAGWKKKETLIRATGSRPYSPVPCLR